MKTLKTYESYNFRRYSAPWVAPVNPKTGKPDFSERVGGYTGNKRKGEGGDLYVIEPQEGTVYMYGQKDYRGGNTSRDYALYRNGRFIPVTSARLVSVLQGYYGCLKEDDSDE